MIKHYCDKCGKELMKDTKGKFIEITRMPYGRAVFTHYSFELCNDFLKGLAEYLGAEIDEEENFDETTDVNNS